MKTQCLPKCILYLMIASTTMTHRSEAVNFQAVSLPGSAAAGAATSSTGGSNIAQQAMLIKFETKLAHRFWLKQLRDILLEYVANQSDTLTQSVKTKIQNGFITKRRGALVATISNLGIEMAGFETSSFMSANPRQSPSSYINTLLNTKYNTAAKRPFRAAIAEICLIGIANDLGNSGEWIQILGFVSSLETTIAFNSMMAGAMNNMFQFLSRMNPAALLALAPLSGFLLSGALAQFMTNLSNSNLPNKNAIMEKQGTASSTSQTNAQKRTKAEQEKGQQQQNKDNKGNTDSL